MSHARSLLILPAILFVAACSSGGLRIVETGFTATETSPSRFVVKFESEEVRSAEEAEANLLVHAARWTIDHSGFYFTLSDRIEGQESEIDLEKDSREDSGTGVPTITSGGTGGYTSSTTGKRRTSFSLRATLRIYRERPEDVKQTIYEATKVLDQYRKARTSGASSSIGIGSKS